MKFIFKFLTGFVLLMVTLGFVGLGAYKLNAALNEDGGKSARPLAERSFIVNTVPLDSGTVSPESVAFGEIYGWKMLELRAPVSGRIIEIAPDFRDGITVKKGTLLYLIDPTEAKIGVADAEAALAEAEAEFTEAEEQLIVTDMEIAAARKQMDLRAAALIRQKKLKKQGHVSSAGMETAELAFSSAEQAFASRKQSIVASRNRIKRAELRIKRATISLQNALRLLEDTNYAAPFDGVLNDASIVLGRRVGINEKLGILIDPEALEAGFIVSDEQFSRIIDGQGKLKKISVMIELSLGSEKRVAEAVISRVAPVLEASEGGRRIFAQISRSDVSVFRPGDFIKVLISEPLLNDVAVLPASAVDNNGGILIVDAQNRIQERSVNILRRNGNNVIVRPKSKGLFGALVVRERLPQLGTGVKVSVKNEDQNDPEELEIINPVNQGGN